MAAAIAEREQITVTGVDESGEIRCQAFTVLKVKRVVIDLPFTRCKRTATARVRVICESGHEKFLFLCADCLLSVWQGLFVCRKCNGNVIRYKGA